MHLRSKQAAFGGIALALTLVLIYLGSVLSTSTLFFLAAAAFLAGGAYREFGRAYGWTYYVAALLGGSLLTPNPMYVITYGVLAAYILLSESLYPPVARIRDKNKRSAAFWLIRLLCFNAVAGLALLIFLKVIPLLVIPGEFLKMGVPGIVAGGQLFFILFELAYNYFQRVLWERIRKNL